MTLIHTRLQRYLSYGLWESSLFLNCWDFINAALNSKCNRSLGVDCFTSMRPCKKKNDAWDQVVRHSRWQLTISAQENLTLCQDANSVPSGRMHYTPIGGEKRMIRGFRGRWCLPASYP